jgi:hypothetical protein
MGSSRTALREPAQPEEAGSGSPWPCPLGIGEFHVLAHVVGRQVDRPAAMATLQGQRTVGMQPGHAPLITIADPVLPGAETPVVLTGHHLVPDACHGTTGYRLPIPQDGARGDPISLRTGVEEAANPPKLVPGLVIAEV